MAEHEGYGAEVGAEGGGGAVGVLDRVRIAVFAGEPRRATHLVRELERFGALAVSNEGVDWFDAARDLDPELVLLDPGLVDHRQVAEALAREPRLRHAAVLDVSPEGLLDDTGRANLSQIARLVAPWVAEEREVGLRIRSEVDVQVDVARLGASRLLRCVLGAPGTFRVSFEHGEVALTVRDGLVQEAQMDGALADVEPAVHRLRSEPRGVLRVQRIAEPQRKMIFGPNTTQALAGITDAPAVIAHAERTLQREVPDLVEASSRPPPPEVASKSKSKMQTRVGVGAPPSESKSRSKVRTQVGLEAPVAESSKPRMRTQVGVGAPPVPSPTRASKIKTKVGLDAPTPEPASASKVRTELGLDAPPVRAPAKSKVKTSFGLPAVGGPPLALADTVDVALEDGSPEMAGLMQERLARAGPVAAVQGSAPQDLSPPSPLPAAVPQTRPPPARPMLRDTPEPLPPRAPIGSAAPPSVEPRRPVAEARAGTGSRFQLWVGLGLVAALVMLIVLVAAGFLWWRTRITGVDPVIPSNATPVREASSAPAVAASPPAELGSSASSPVYRASPAAPPADPVSVADAVPAPDPASATDPPTVPEVSSETPPVDPVALGLDARAEPIDVSNALVAQGRRARSGRDRAAAERLFRQAVDVAEFNPRAHASLAELLYRTGRTAEALAPARRAVELGSTRASYHVLLGDILDALRRTDDAAREWRRALELRPDARVRARLRGVGAR